MGNGVSRRDCPSPWTLCQQELGGLSASARAKVAGCSCLTRNGSSRLRSGTNHKVKSCWVGLCSKSQALTRKCSQWGMCEACLTSVCCDQGILWEPVIWVQKYSYLINRQGFSIINKRSLFFSVNTAQQERKFSLSVFYGLTSILHLLMHFNKVKRLI